MKIKAYLYFPDSEVAFQNLSANPDSYNKIIRELKLIKKELKNNSDYELNYDQTNISEFLEIANGLVKEEYLGSIKKQLHTIIGYKNNNVTLPKLRNNQAVYANWSIDFNVIVTPSVIAEAAEASKKDSKSEKTICICLGDSLNVIREELHVIKDAIYINKLPDLIHVVATNNNSGFVKWITTLPEGKFRLKGNNDFQPLDRFRFSERIYKHKASGNLWYFDWYHRKNKIHYEVFDSTGNKHLGEFDSDGNLIEGTADPSKTIGEIIQ